MFCKIPWHFPRKLVYTHKHRKMSDRRFVLEFLYKNVTQDKDVLLKSSGMPLRTFYRNYAILRTGGSLERKRGSGRPLKIQGNQKKRLVQIALKNPTYSTENVKKQFLEISDTNLSTSTVYRALSKSGIRKKLPKVVPNITPVHELKRAEFAQNWLDYDFKDVFLTDECIFQLYRNKI